MAVSIYELLEAIGLESSAATQKTVMRIKKAAETLIESYAANAPDTVKDQACIMMTGYIHEAPASAPARMNFSNALQNSGAASLLAPWREHQAGVCE